MASTEFEGLNIAIPESPDLASLCGEFECPQPPHRPATAPVYVPVPGNVEEKQVPKSHQPGNNTHGGDGKKKRPESAPVNLALDNRCSKDYHRALCEIRKKELREQRINQRGRAETVNTANRMLPATHQGSASRQLSRVQFKEEQMETTTAGQNPREEHVWDSSSTVVPTSRLSSSLRPTPDGGLFAWPQAIASFLVAFNCWGLPLTFGVLEPYYRSALAPRTIPQIAWIGSTQLALPFLSAPVFNTIYEGDIRFFRVLFHGGTSFLIAAMLATSWFANFPAVYGFQGLIAGTALGMLCCAYGKVLRSWFEKKLGIVVAISVVGATAGSICYSLTIAHLLPWIGYAWTFRAITLIIVATMIFPTIIMRPRRSEPKMKKPNKVVSKRDFLDISYILMLVGMFLSFLVLYFPYFYITSYTAAALSISPASTTSANFLLTMLAAGLPGRTLAVLLANHWAGPLTLLIPASLLSAIFTYLLVGASAAASSLHLLAGVYGFTSAVLLALYAPTARAFAEQPVGDFVLVSHRGDEGSTQVEGVAPLRMTAAYWTVGAAVLGGGPIGGLLLEMAAEKRVPGPEGFLYAFVWVGSCLAVAAVCFVGSRVAKVGWKGGKI